MSLRLIAVGASAGGVTAVQKLLNRLPVTFTAPIAVVLHLPANAVVDHALVFGSTTRKIVEAFDKLPAESNGVYFAPPGYHLLLEKDLTFSLSQDEPVHYSRPSIDVFFDSVAHAIGPYAAGVLMTGANADGADGLFEMHQAGGFTCVQDPEEAEVNVMPRAALELFKPAFVGGVMAIADKLNERVQSEVSC